MIGCDECTGDNPRFQQLPVTLLQGKKEKETTLCNSVHCKSLYGGRERNGVESSPPSSFIFPSCSLTIFKKILNFLLYTKARFFVC